MPYPPSAVKTLRTPLRTYHPANAPQRVACMTYLDPDVGIVAHSVRSLRGILRVSQCLNFDAGVLVNLRRDNAQWCEIAIRDTGMVYAATIDAIEKYGHYERRAGGQFTLALRHWFVGWANEAALQVAGTVQTPEPEIGQLSLFGDR